jgi:hypothetical protein
MPVRLLALLLVIGLPLAGQTPAPRPSPAAAGAGGARAIRGTYERYLSAGAGCTVEILERGADSVRFQLGCSRGAPSYNSGTTDGVIALRDGKAVYYTTEYGGSCELRFVFGRARVTVTEVEVQNGCGFGYGVVAEGTLRRTSRRRPAFDLSPDGRPLPPI